MTLRVLDLFSGIGGFALGLERTGGFRTVAFCEADPFCRTLSADRLAGDGIAADVLCGGFPCQDISVAGAGAGLDGARSGPSRAKRPPTSGDQLPNTVGGPLNPTWVEWLMGFPPGWTDCGPSATPSSPRSSK